MLESRERRGTYIIVAQRHEVDIRPLMIPNGVVAGLPVMKGKGSSLQRGLCVLSSVPSPAKHLSRPSTMRNSNENERSYQKGFSEIF